MKPVKPGKPVKPSKHGKSKKPSGSKNKAEKVKNLLILIPVRNCKWTRKPENKELIRLFKPRFKSKLGKRVGKKLDIKPTYNVNLDEFGTAVWRICDGKLTVNEIGDILKTQFGESVEPLYPRLGEFFRILESNDLIIMKSKRVRKKRKTID